MFFQTQNTTSSNGQFQLPPKSISQIIQNVEKTKSWEKKYGITQICNYQMMKNTHTYRLNHSIIF